MMQALATGAGLPGRRGGIDVRASFGHGILLHFLLVTV
ncbi:hypothetical protein ABID44_002748 [Aquamicrobium ahrensii]|uniref:Transposase n=1 Tax=Aquamicrobium ahrensii TaxID=469551 RepID=A0ABV2KP78_9HYPH